MEKHDDLYLQEKDSKADILSSNNSTDNIAGPQQPEARPTLYHMSVRLMDLVNHVLIILVTVFLLRYSLQSFNVTNLHVALCTVGYVLLMSEAIAVLAGENILTNFLSRRAKSHVHWVLQVLGLIFTIAGVVIMYRVKTVHFKSIHAITGITSLATMCVLTAFGYPVLIAVKLRKIIRPVIIKFIHNFLGTSCFVVGMVSQCYGYNKNWLAWATGDMPNIEIVCTILTAIITILSLRGSLVSLSRQALTLFR